MTRKFEATVRISGHINNYIVDENNCTTFHLKGNKKSSEQSILNQVKTYLRLTGCKLEEVIEIKEV